MAVFSTQATTAVKGSVSALLACMQSIGVEGRAQLGEAQAAIRILYSRYASQLFATAHRGSSAVE